MMYPHLIRLHFFVALVFILTSLGVTAHDVQQDTHIVFERYNEPLLLDPITYILAVSVLLVLLTIGALLAGNRLKKKQKKFFFLIMVIPTVLASFYLAGHTVYDNVTSATGGPVHWHADYQIWACGTRLDLTDPRGLNNKIGVPLLHEHNDDRMHVEGTLRSLDEVSLGAYFAVVGGEITNDHFIYPTDAGKIHYTNTDLCPDGKTGVMQVFVNGKRVDNPQNYVLSPHINVPPGDCIIVDFDPVIVQETTRICESLSAKGLTYGDVYGR